MKYALHIGKEPNFQLVVIASAVIHLVLITLIVVPLRTKDNEYKSYFVNLVGPVELNNPPSPPFEKGGRIDSPPLKKGGLGGFSSQEIFKTPSEADMSLESAERVSKEIERIRSISRLSKQRTNKEEEKRRDIEIIRRKIQGSALRGAGPSVQALAPDSYYSMITRKIWGEWAYPDAGSSGLEVIISMKIEKDGKIASHEIEKKSGNALFDRSAVKAVSKAGPLPPPPFEMEIGVRFFI